MLVMAPVKHDEVHPPVLALANQAGGDLHRVHHKNPGQTTKRNAAGWLLWLAYQYAFVFVVQRQISVIQNQR
jgi:hypothetical protein